MSMPELRWHDGREHEFHMGVRFGDMRQAGPEGRWLITLDGVDVTMECNEAFPGRAPMGWVLLAPPPKSTAEGQHNYVRVHGDVSVAWVRAEPSPW